MEWRHAIRRHVGGPRVRALILLLLVISPTSGFPYRNPAPDGVKDVTESSASTVEVLRNMQKLLGITKSLAVKTKQVKQAETGAETEGAANALAYLTDSFGGQLAGQILSVILSSVTGDVRGILGNSLNLFQTDETRDRVQFFLDELSQNFLKITGLGALTTTKPPLQQNSTYPLLVGPGSGQIQRIKPAGTIPITPLQSGSTLIRPGVPELPSSSGSGQKVQSGQSTGQQQQIIYLLPNLSGDTGTAAVGSGTTGSKVTTGTGTRGSSSTNTGDDDSEEDRDR